MRTTRLWTVEYLVFLAAGAVAGLLAGLLGIGGGLVVVPILVLVFGTLHVPESVLTHLALGTSLATIVVTAASSSWAHHQKGGVRWDLVRWLAPGIVAGAYLGAWLASILEGGQLQIVVGVYALLTSAQMGSGIEPRPSRSLPRGAGLVAIGLAIGLASAVFGIGGGSLLVPVLYWCNLRMQEAVGTAAFCGLPLALVGALTNVYTGAGHPDLPFGAMGFVHLPAAGCIVLVSLPCARWGAHLAHRVSARRLKRIFAGFLATVGLALIAVSTLGDSL